MAVDSVGCGLGDRAAPLPCLGFLTSPSRTETSCWVLLGPGTGQPRPVSPSSHIPGSVGGGTGWREAVRLGAVAWEPVSNRTWEAPVWVFSSLSP